MRTMTPLSTVLLYSRLWTVGLVLAVLTTACGPSASPAATQAPAAPAKPAATEPAAAANPAAAGSPAPAGLAATAAAPAAGGAAVSKKQGGTLTVDTSAEQILHLDPDQMRGNMEKNV